MFSENLTALDLIIIAGYIVAIAWWVFQCSQQAFQHHLPWHGNTDGCDYCSLAGGLLYQFSVFITGPITSSWCNVY